MDMVYERWYARKKCQRWYQWQQAVICIDPTASIYEATTSIDSSLHHLYVHILLRETENGYDSSDQKRFIFGAALVKIEGSSCVESRKDNGAKSAVAFCQMAMYVCLWIGSGHLQRFLQIANRDSFSKGAEGHQLTTWKGFA